MITYIFTPAGVLSVIALYGYLTRKLTGEARRETTIILIGFIILIVGHVLSIELFKNMFYTWIGFVYTPLMIAGSLIFTITYYRQE